MQKATRRGEHENSRGGRGGEKKNRENCYPAWMPSKKNAPD